MAIETSRPLKVLISAYACEPDLGSEPGIGWNTVCQIAQKHDVWVVTRTNNRTSIEKALERAPKANLHFVYFDLPRWARFWKRGQRGVRIYYYLWQMTAHFAIRKVVRDVKFDIAHHITFGTYSYPSLLTFLPIPFVWGTVGGGESAPRLYWKGFSWRGRAHEMFRSMMRRRGEWDPFARFTARKAAVAVATTHETAQRIRSMGATGEIVIQSVAALNDSDLRDLLSIPLRSSSPFRVISVGRLLHWKGFHLALEAFARLHADYSDCELWFVGDGPERRRLEKMARRLQIEHRVTFWGQVSRRETLQKVADCDVMLFPSLHDSGGWASIESMAAGRPVVCLDLGGPALQVSAETGFKISADDPCKAIHELAGALISLAQDPSLRMRMSIASRKRVQEIFNWRHVGETFEALYQLNASSKTNALALTMEGQINTLRSRASRGNVSLGRNS